MVSQPKTRIAPTPSGLLHVGNAFSFLLTSFLAKKIGAKILLRVDDIDNERSRPEYIQDIFETLDWLGIHCDEGPRGLDDFEQSWSQRLRVAEAGKQCIASLQQQPGKTFACECSRKELANHIVYPGTCMHKGIPLDTPETSLRVFVPENKRISINGKPFPLGREMGSFVIRRRDGVMAYQLASLMDDVYFGITHIVRGEDLRPSTAAQIYLAELLGLVAFAKCSFFHHPLLTNDLGEKLSKSKGAGSLREMRMAGHGAEQIKECALEYFERNFGP